jgi:fatty acid desaturase
MVPINMVIKIFYAVVNPKKFTWSIVYPFLEVVILYLLKRDLLNSFLLFFFMQACFGFSITKCIFCGHRTQDMWTAGNERIEDFGEHTLATTCDTTTDLKGFLSMALFAGFNQHIAHHFFPTIDHYHLNKVLPIIK